MEFLAVQNGFTVRDAFHRFHKGPEEQQDTQKMEQNRRPTVTIYLSELST